jgi:ABC-type dipeptide/oligopeptide/nickel transport system ATPase subunit
VDKFFDDGALRIVWIRHARGHAAHFVRRPAPAVKRLIIQRRAGLASQPDCGQFGVSPRCMRQTPVPKDVGQYNRTQLRSAGASDGLDPKVLILDDALSTFDTCTKEEIVARLTSVMRQRTSIIDSHRISTERNADQIFVLTQGRIVDDFTHEALVRLNRLYTELHRKQFLEEELAAS